MASEPSCLSPSTAIPMSSSLWQIVVGKLGLPPQQARVVWCLLLGMEDKEIALELGLSQGTLRSYLDRVCRRVGVRGRHRLVSYVFSMAISHLEECCQRS